MIRYGSWSVTTTPSVEDEVFEIRRVRAVEHRLGPRTDLGVAVLTRRQQPETVRADAVHDELRDLLHRRELHLPACRTHRRLPLAEAAVRRPARPLLRIPLGPVAVRLHRPVRSMCGPGKSTDAPTRACSALQWAYRDSVLVTTA